MLENEISKLKSNDLSDIRRKHIGFVFQNPELIPELNVLKNVLIPTRNTKDKVIKADNLLS